MSRSKLEETSAKNVVKSVMNEANMRIQKTAQPVIGNIVELLQELKQKGVFLAMSTADNLSNTISHLLLLGIFDYFDVVLCEDGKVIRGAQPIKGSAPAENLGVITEALGVPLEKTIVVGDTRTDIRLGVVGGAGLTLGVMSGIGKLEDLMPTDGKSPKANDVLKDISEIRKYFQ